ncbi:hypothetical protein Pst134EA_032939, partial [Puccinia striiformis f. sp. tritici]|uniref:uncharacterized protein n=1 Tax=Puccinia striiformis f. sp. tritici TaxID=168172 RepID=UPI002007650C
IPKLDDAKIPVVLHQVVQGDSIPDIDNLYLDMNGIIHSCNHPSTPDANFKITEPEIFSGIFASLEHLLKPAKPRKLFFLAVDGVAPRAKMNEQRSRRFKAAKANAAMIPRSQRGSELMLLVTLIAIVSHLARLSWLDYMNNSSISSIRKYRKDPAWQAIHVIFSGHDVPGEGEHKIMQYIRHAKTLDTYDPHLRHCIYGLDADLIMLALLSHEPHFCLLQEENRLPLRENRPSLEGSTISPSSNSFFFRDYLNWEFSSLPSAIGVLFEIYKRVLPQAGGYLNDSGILHTHRLQLILDELVSHEYKSFESSHGIGLKRPGRPGVDYPVNDTQFALVQQVENFIRSNVYSPNKSTAKLVLPESHAPLISLGFEEDDSDDLRLADPVVDAVYGILRDLRVDGVNQPGTQKDKMRLHHHDCDQLHKLTHAYIEGLQWVLHYYYTGIASWSWAYPYHYSMITDLDKVTSYKFSFDLGNPFKPFEQLMGVLPGLSSTHVPPAFQDLMTKPESPIFDLYPSHFETDLNGKKKKRLLKAMKDHEFKLKDEEVERNRFGPTWQFRYDSQKADYYPSPIPGKLSEKDAASQNIEKLLALYL